jgi:hypothetical protein
MFVWTRLLDFIAVTIAINIFSDDASHDRPAPLPKVLS